MSWRYQPVYQIHDGEKYYSLCEVYLNKDRTLSSWTVDPAMKPSGTGDIDDLKGTLLRMLVDAHRWEPVEFSTLHPGMTFARLDFQKQAARMASLLVAIGTAIEEPHS